MKNLSFLFSLLVLFSCSKKEDPIDLNDDTVGQNSEEKIIEIPMSNTDYDDMANWVFHPNKTTVLSNYNLDISVVNENLEIESVIPITNNSRTNTGVDVFFVHPTILTQNDIPENIAIDDQPDFLISSTILVQGGLLSKYGRFFAPRYRQSTGQAFKVEISESERAPIIATSYSDVKAAFLNYLEHHNNGNKIILAGHSQGSYHLSMLLRDVFDDDASLRNKLITAALGGMSYIHAPQGDYSGGLWENITLCTTTDQCGCVHNWAAFAEEQELPDTNYGLPQFNSYIVNSGLYYKEFDQNTDWFVHDSAYYGMESQSLEYYIAPDANYNLGGTSNFIAFKDLYNVRFRRNDSGKVALSVEHNPLPNDNRPNDLANEILNPNYDWWGYHIKDYHIYLWALMQQIEEKLSNCSG